MKWDSNSPRAYQVISQREDVLAKVGDGVATPASRHFSDSDVRCEDQMSLGVKNEVNTSASWPKLKHFQRPVNKERREEYPRPRTATLERPRVLNISLIGKIDMTRLTRKGLLSISNLCIAPLEAKRNGASLRGGPGGKTRKFTVPQKSLRRRTQRDSEDDDSSAAVSPPPAPPKQQKQQRRRVSRDRKKGATSNQSEEDDSSASVGTKQPLRVPNKRKTVLQLVAEKGRAPVVLPQPCTTCGRPEQPERLHSHPPPRQATPASVASQPPPKSSVRKPVPINFRSSMSSSTVPAPQPKPPPEVKAPEKTGRPRTVVCYICGREFGTKSYPLHEPHCLQRWQRENAALPQHLQRPLPQKPDQPLTSEQWNQMAWHTMQASLVPCENCGRTFNPDRLEIHQRSCKANNIRKTNAASAPQQEDEESTPAPRASPCRVCGRMFGSASIAIHEPQCQQRASKAAAAAASESGSAPDSGRPRRPRMLLCYLCGRGFSSASLPIHEAQCLKRWRMDNEKLPPNLQRPEPERPAVVLTEAGGVDLDATIDAAWQSHLQQLVPCPTCSRTFYPDRLEVHQRACKGNNNGKR